MKYFLSVSFFIISFFVLGHEGHGVSTDFAWHYLELVHILPIIAIAYLGLYVIPKSIYRFIQQYL
ncbi:MAG: hypothetical protein JXQ90_23245 [Cyclobacteriaceae bacterium]